MNDVEGREDLVERRWIVDVPTHVIAYRSIIDNTHSCVLLGARSGRVFFNKNNGRENLSKAEERAALAFNSTLKAILRGIQRSVCQGKRVNLNVRS